MNIFDKHPLPWEAIEVTKGEAAVIDAASEYIAQFDSVVMANWAIDVWMLAQGTELAEINLP